MPAAWDYGGLLSQDVKLVQITLATVESDCHLMLV